MNSEKSILTVKSYDFAIHIVKLSKYLQDEKREFILSKQIMRSGTAIGALLYEAEFGQSKADYIHKFSISLKEANETKYWLSLLYDTGYLDGKLFESLFNDSKEIISLLVASIKTLKKRQ